MMDEFIKFVGNDAKLTEKFLQDHPNFEKLIVNDANDENMQKTTALLQAAKRGHAKVVEVLLKHGADVTAADTAGRSSIHFLLRYARNNICIAMVYVLRSSTIKAKRMILFQKPWSYYSNISIAISCMI